MTGRLGLIVAVAVLLTMLAGVPASAATTTGRWSLIDTPRYPGATCVFHTSPDDELHQIHVRAPVIFAVDATTGVDTEIVGWRLLVQYSDDSMATWHVLEKGPIVKASATDRYNAQWSSLTGVWKRGTGALHGAYRAMVSMIWYDPKGKIQGLVQAVVANYVDFYNGANQEPNTFCGDTLG